MKLVLLADEERKTEFLSVPPADGCEITWFREIPAGETVEGDLLVDLYTGFALDRINWIQQQQVPCVMVSYPVGSGVLPDGFIRINGWPGMIGSIIIEACATDPEIRRPAEHAAGMLNRKVEWTDEANGFISQRIIAGIINEAYLAVSESVAVESDIDTAMKLGTNYPYGPFEWARKIGFTNLLIALEYNIKENEQRNISILLKEKALAQ